MDNGKLGVAMIPRLNSVESIIICKADPVAYVESMGGSVSHLDDRSLRVLHDCMVKIDVPASTPLLTGFSIRCTGCKAGLAFTVAGLTVAITAVIAFAIGGTAGADAPAAPAEAVAGAAGEMAVIGAETGLEASAVAATTTGVLQTWVAWAAANKVAAVALAASGAALAEIASDIIEAICERAGLCS
jgi:hypothetical protein